ncbi:quinol:electron acceptor oxidoreductase subunit ActD [Lichenicoccus sp.]|uniref:quinol:electron acceptor oxidoreductase subunit ActD n=1 Tax=Lichenicoccus sp. TaxID=2781899 RepID=UPI003D101DBB
MTPPALQPGLRWWLGLAASIGLIGVLLISLGWLLYEGTGVWGNNIPVTWALDIVSYDWWIGIACGALLVSSAMLLFGTPERDALNRITETVAVLAAVAAAVYPIIHLGRPWFFYWNLPYPNTMLLQPQVRSPLFWDAIDILAYLTISVSFWATGLLPDLARLRDRASERITEGDPDYENRRRLRARLYGVAALGWRGSAMHWHRWRQAMRCLAVLGLLIVPTLQSGAAVMFAGTVLPGWHDTIMPVSFLVGAVFSGVAAVALVSIVARSALRLQRSIDARPLALLAWLLLGLGLAELYCEAAGIYATLLGGDSTEIASLHRRLAGDQAWAFWTMLAAGPLAAQLFWLPFVRRSAAAIASLGASICLGMWADHFMVIVPALEHDFLPSSAHAYTIGFWGLATFAGSGGLFLFLLLVLLRILPAVVLSLRTQQDPHPAAQFKSPSHGAPLWGVAAEFDQPGRMIEAARQMMQEHGIVRPGISRLDLFSPVPLADADAALALASRGVPEAAVTGFLLGALSMFGYCATVSTTYYVLDIGGRPWFSWPSFIVPSVSSGLLCAALGTVGVLLVKNRLPRLNHPAFNIPNFNHASHDRYFLVLEGLVESFPAEKALAALHALQAGPVQISRVPR